MAEPTPIPGSLAIRGRRGEWFGSSILAEQDRDGFARRLEELEARARNSDPVAAAAAQLAAAEAEVDRLQRADDGLQEAFGKAEAEIERLWAEEIDNLISAAVKGKVAKQLASRLQACQAELKVIRQAQARIRQILKPRSRIQIMRSFGAKQRALAAALEAEAEAHYEKTAKILEGVARHEGVALADAAPGSLTYELRRRAAILRDEGNRSAHEADEALRRLTG